MNDQQQRWQEDGKKAFDWIAEVYSQTRTAREDAQALFEQDGWTWKFRDRWGGDAYTTVLSDWPFVYLTAACALAPDVKGSEPTGTAAVFGFFFYDSERKGPQCFAGRARWSQADAKIDHWALYGALGGVGESKQNFDRKGTLIKTATPNQKGRAWRPGLEEVCWFEVPLATITSADALRDVVVATQALVAGDESPADRLIKAL
jgi:hypothetical protein